MMLKYHLLLGGIGSILLNDYQFLLGSILPDVVLIHNELKLVRNKKSFNPKEVSTITLTLYRLTHSLLFLILLTNLPHLALGWLFHQVMDWRSHDGIFRTRIFYPFSKKTI